ncbi:MAG: ASKHA domain-containing protein [Thiohalomonadaceae bacterium]
MPILLVRVDGVAHRLPFAPGQPVRSVLDATDFRVRSACHGIGACGLCRVRVIEGDAGPPTPNERFHLAGEQLAQGVRLACQVRPLADLAVEILNRAPPSPWKNPPFPLVRARGPENGGALRPTPAAVTHPLGLAVDLGTTHISLALWNLRDGALLAERWGRNPQVEHGADVISRLMAASASPATAAALARAVLEAMGKGLWDISAREGFEPRQVVRVTVVGNTAMLALLTGCGYERLLQPAHWNERIACAAADVAPRVVQWGVHDQAEVEVMPPLAGFVGSDLLAGLVATRLVEGEAPALFIDVGTNSEMALWNGQELWVTAAAGGPAFESCGTRHGMPAETGAIYRVDYDAARDVLDYQVLGEVEGVGICGSGLVDLLAALRRSGRLDARGHLHAPGQPAGRFAFRAGGPEMAITDHDVDALQRAKAALSTGIRVLCARAGVSPSALARVYVAGAFGHHLGIANAQAIGLLPAIDPARVVLVGNTALAGCSDLLLRAHARDRFFRLQATAEVVNLAQSPEFDELFLAGLYLDPIAAPA